MSDQPTEKQIQSAYTLAKERYAALGVDADQALDVLAQIPLSLHCWQGDDVGGFENPDAELSGGIARSYTVQTCACRGLYKRPFYCQVRRSAKQGEKVRSTMCSAGMAVGLLHDVELDQLSAAASLDPLS